MTYIKNNWQSGDVVTSAKLNHLEDGIANAGGAMVVHDNGGTLDKTWQEIYDALSVGVPCIINGAGAVDMVTSVYEQNGIYFVAIQLISYQASTASEYPVGGFGYGGES